MSNKFNRRLMAVAAALTLSLPMPATAADAGFIFPLACTLGEDCWVIQHPDVDPGPGAEDYTGHHRTYDGHTGIDIGLATVAQMDAGVGVLAVADGKVLRSRDGVDDVLVETAAQIEAVDETECGNGMVIEHADGLETQYCHMRKGSVLVKPGETVKAGQKLGLVGASGLASFPHLHITTRLNGIVIEPTTGKALDPNDAGKISEPKSVWAKASGLLTYDPTDIVLVGFHDGEVKVSDAISGKLDKQQMSTSPGNLVIWTVIYGVRQGDKLRLEILDPAGGHFFDLTRPIEKSQIRIHRFAGKKVRQPLKPGTYTGRVTISRTDENGKPFKEMRQTTIRIEN